jgi:hypothetical protein
MIEKFKVRADKLEEEFILFYNNLLEMPITERETHKEEFEKLDNERRAASRQMALTARRSLPRRAL